MYPNMYSSDEIFYRLGFEKSDGLMNASLKNLSEQGVTAPTRISWYSK